MTLELAKPMFPLTDDQQSLRERARQFAREVVAPHVEEMDRTNNYPWSVVKAMAEQRFMGMNVPREYGGDARSLLDVVLVVEEVAKICGTAARIVVDGNMGIVGAIRHYGTEAQRRRYLPWVLDGEKPAIAITEPEAGSAATMMTTSGNRRDGESFVLERGEALDHRSGRVATLSGLCPGGRRPRRRRDRGLPGRGDHAWPLGPEGPLDDGTARDARG